MNFHYQKRHNSFPPSAMKIFFPNSATRTAAVTFPCLADGRGFLRFGLLTGGKVETSSDLDLLLALQSNLAITRVEGGKILKQKTAL